MYLLRGAWMALSLSSLYTVQNCKRYTPDPLLPIQCFGNLSLWSAWSTSEASLSFISWVMTVRRWICIYLHFLHSEEKIEREGDFFSRYQLAPPQSRVPNASFIWFNHVTSSIAPHDILSVLFVYVIISLTPRRFSLLLVTNCALID